MDKKFLKSNIFLFFSFARFYFTRIQKNKNVEIADWLKLDINTCEKILYQNTIFLSGGNPYNTLEFIE
jgi:hypothetical protein